MDPEMSVTKLSTPLPVTDEMLTEAEEARQAWNRWMSATPQQRAQWAQEAADRRAVERSATVPRPLTVESLLDAIGWSREYAEHVVQPYCNCSDSDDGWDLLRPRPGPRTGSVTVDRERVDNLLDTIDGALDDYAVSDDAMRWSPDEVRTEDTLSLGSVVAVLSPCESPLYEVLECGAVNNRTFVAPEAGMYRFPTFEPVQPEELSP